MRFAAAVVDALMSSAAAAPEALAPPAPGSPRGVAGAQALSDVGLGLRDPEHVRDILRREAKVPLAPT